MDPAGTLSIEGFAELTPPTFGNLLSNMALGHAVIATAFVESLRPPVQSPNSADRSTKRCMAEVTVILPKHSLTSPFGQS